MFRAVTSTSQRELSAPRRRGFAVVIDSRRGVKNKQKKRSTAGDLFRQGRAWVLYLSLNSTYAPVVYRHSARLQFPVCPRSFLTPSRTPFAESNGSADIRRRASSESDEFNCRGTCGSFILFFFFQVASCDFHLNNATVKRFGSEPLHYFPLFHSPVTTPPPLGPRAPQRF